ncbi:MAG: alginate export family protein, partial [Candidatus Omnitrophica bacterium]|nr:alginate export family protein [Candidatus Omnitrophota bacterium]
LINERVWNGQNDTADGGNGSIDLDLAYVTLKEFLYSPLTLTIGRQELRFGNTLIIGNAGIASGVVNIPTDLTERKSFDAIRATLNYDPLVVDLIYAKVNEQSTIRNNDTDLMGINASYAINKKANVSAYYFLKSNNNNGVSNSLQKADKVNTIGALLSISPIEDLTASLEAAYQFGKVAGEIAPSNNYNRRNAYAVQAMVDYNFSKIKMTPKIGASYTYLSGDKNGDASSQSGWDAMYSDQNLGNIAHALLAFSDLSVWNLKAAFKPMEDVTLSVLYGYFDMAREKKDGWNYTSAHRYDGVNRYFTATNLKDGRAHLGDEIDATIAYDYTEDVQFGLTGGLFVPGSAWDADNHKRNATQLIGSMKVTF